MSMIPKISVITINYNNMEGFEKTLSNVTSQNFENFEYIIIDGGSSDGSQNLIKKYSSKISYSISETDNGIYHAMNKGIQAAKGQYLIFINSGDHFYDCSALMSAESFLDGKTDIITGKLNVVDTKKHINFIIENPSTLNFRTLFEGTILHPCTFIKRSCFSKVGMYDEGLKIVSDWKWFLLAATKFGLSYKTIPITISTFYLDGVSELPENQQKINHERQITLLEEFPLFVEDYRELVKYRQNTEVLNNVRNSKWVKMGLSLGLMKHEKFKS